MAPKLAAVPQEQLQDKEVLVKKIEGYLDEWMDGVLLVSDVLLWKKSWHLPFLITYPTMVSLLIWLLDLPFLKVLGLGGLIATFLEFAAPMAFSMLHQHDSKKQKVKREERFSATCEKLATTFIVISTRIRLFRQLRSDRPVLYYGTLLPFLLMLPLLGGVMNGYFFTSAIVTILLLLPGLERRGILTKCNIQCRLWAAKVLRKIAGTKAKQ